MVRVDGHCDGLSEPVIGHAIEVHRALGPGLLESAYEECLCFELKNAGREFRRQVPLPVTCKAIELECAYRMDIVVDGRLVIELKTVDQLLRIHEAQLLTYLRLGGFPTGLLLNFHAAVLKDGIKRLVF